MRNRGEGVRFKSLVQSVTVQVEHSSDVKQRPKKQLQKHSSRIEQKKTDSRVSNLCVGFAWGGSSVECQSELLQLAHKRQSTSHYNKVVFAALAY